MKAHIMKRKTMFGSDVEVTEKQVTLYDFGSSACVYTYFLFPKARKSREFSSLKKIIALNWA